jgi:hypothetical protein
MARRRAGNTIKLSVSLGAEDVAVLKRHAKEAYGGNLSAALGEAARLLRQKEARRRLIEQLGGAPLTPEAAATIDAEFAGGPRYEGKRAVLKGTRRRKATA